MKAYIVPNITNNGVLPACEKLCNTLENFGITPLIDCELQGTLKLADRFFASAINNAKKADVIISLGGDGSFLHAAYQHLQLELPIFGINIGRLGFLTCLDMEELSRLQQLKTGNYSVLNRMLLSVTSQDGKLDTDIINDVVVAKKTLSKAVSFDIFCDNILINSYRGDGVIISTPTGSTAYNLSAGGPLLDADIYAICVTPLCAHSLSSPPVVYSENRILRISVPDINSEAAQLTCDGKAIQKVTSDIIIQKSSKTLKVLVFAKEDPLVAIDKKLKGR